MTDSAPQPARIRDANAAVEAAKSELIDTVRELQQRLQLSTLASGAWEAAKNKGANLAEDAVDAVKGRPLAIGGAAAVLGLFLARAPIKDVARRFYDGMTSATDEPPAKAELKPTTTVSRRTPRAARKSTRAPAKKPTRTEKPA